MLKFKRVLYFRVLVFANLMLLGIFVKLKINALNFKINITKKIVTKLAFALALVAAAYVLDIYFGNHPDEAQEIQAESQSEQSNNQEMIYFVAQVVPINVKTFTQNVPTCKLQIQSHNKFLREHHLIRNHQVLKAEVATQTTPLISSYHYLVYQNHSFPPGEEPLA